MMVKDRGDEYGEPRSPPGIDRMVFVVVMNSPEQDDGMIRDFDIWQATNSLIRETVERHRAT